MGLRCIHTEVDRRGINPKTDWKLFREYCRLIKQERPDMVITYSIKPNVYGGIAAAMKGIACCANVQGLGTAFQRRGLALIATVLYKIALRKVKTVFFENQGNAQEFIDRGIIAPEKITILPGAGINLQAYAYKPYPDNDRFHFLYLGRIMKEKGIDELFDAVRRLHQQMGDQVVLDLVGFFDDDYEQEVKQLVSDGIAVFHGFQTEPVPFYEAADCVVLPSYHEGMSNVLLEAAAIGRPVITCRIHGCMEAVEEGKTGLLCEVKDTDSLFEAMESMVKCSVGRRAEMGCAARNKMEQEFEKSKVVQRTIQAILTKT
jgi:galacturonosyltransferase